MERILVTGGTGLIGSHLVPRLQEAGYRVAILSRSAGNTREGVPVFHWDVEPGKLDERALEYAETIIHLAGENIAAGRWTSRRKQRIRDSRVKSAELLFRKIRQAGGAVHRFVSASAVGYYGMRTRAETLTETTPPGDDFLATVCRQWEAAAELFTGLGARVVVFRIGMVLTPRGGALQRLALPVRLGLGSPLGRGTQWLPWIHIDDLVEMFLFALREERLQGAYNAVAPGQVTQAEFMRTLAEVLGKPFFLPPVPAALVKWAFGEMAGMVLEGSRVAPQKIVEAGFAFRFPELRPALEHLVGKTSPTA